MLGWEQIVECLPGAVVSDLEAPELSDAALSGQHGSSRMSIHSTNLGESPATGTKQQPRV